MIDHVSLEVSDYGRSKAFYERALGPLGYELVLELDGNVGGFGVGGKPDFWLVGGAPSGGGIHVAFGCDDRGTVDAFHAAALAAGGDNNGQPGLRPQYH